MIDYRVIANLAIEAVRGEYGDYEDYQREQARESLQAVDDLFDWEPLLEELEPKPPVYAPGRVGPGLLTADIMAALKSAYEPVLIEFIQQDSQLLKYLERER